MNELVRWADVQYGRHAHVVMSTRDGRHGFALFGGLRVRHRFGALYLPTTEPLRTRLVLHSPATADGCRKLAARFGLVVFCGDAAPQDLASDLLTVPVTLDMEMATPAIFEGPHAPWGKSAKANISRIKRSRFTCDTVTDVAAVDEFYARMYLPSMRGRHHKEAYIDRKPALLQYARGEGAELLRILQDGQWVGATLNQATPDGYRLHKVGWRNGDERWLKCGVVAATYWFSFRRAAALGQPRVLLGSVMPYLEDGVLLYKGRWGGQLCPVSRDVGSFRLLLDPSHPACRRFLQSSSMIAKGSGSDFIVFSARTPTEAVVAPDVMNGIGRWYVWRDQPLEVPAVAADEVPARLRPWLRAVDVARRPSAQSR